MTGARTYVDAAPTTEPRGNMVEIHMVSGREEYSFVMPLHAAPERCPYFSIVIVHGQGRRPANDM